MGGGHYGSTAQVEKRNRGNDLWEEWAGGGEEMVKNEVWGRHLKWQAAESESECKGASEPSLSLKAQVIRSRRIHVVDWKGGWAESRGEVLGIIQASGNKK